MSLCDHEGGVTLQLLSGQVKSLRSYTGVGVIG